LSHGKIVAKTLQYIAWLAAIASYSFLAARIAILGIRAEFRILFGCCIFQAASAAALLPFDPATIEYARLWTWLQVGVIVLHVVLAFDLAHKSREGFPMLGTSTIVVLAAALGLSILTTVWSRQIDGMEFTRSKPLVAVVLAKRHLNFALFLWGVFIAVFYRTAADRGERRNVFLYRWALLAFFALQGCFYLLIVWNRERGGAIYSALATLSPIIAFTPLALLISKQGNVFLRAPTKFSGLSQAELRRLYSERPHR
jgi:hypothetical protein